MIKKLDMTKNGHYVCQGREAWSGCCGHMRSCSYDKIMRDTCHSEIKETAPVCWAQCSQHPGLATWTSTPPSPSTTGSTSPSSASAPGSRSPARSRWPWSSPSSRATSTWTVPPSTSMRRCRTPIWCVMCMCKYRLQKKPWSFVGWCSAVLRGVDVVLWRYFWDLLDWILFYCTLL